MNIVDDSGLDSNPVDMCVNVDEFIKHWNSGACVSVAINPRIFDQLYLLISELSGITSWLDRVYGEGDDISVPVAVMKKVCKEFSIRQGISMRDLMHGLRVGVTTQDFGPSIYEAMAIMGKVKSLSYLTFFCDCSDYWIELSKDESAFKVAETGYYEVKPYMKKPEVAS